MAFITTTDEHIASGGTITGDLTISGDLTVSGGGTMAYTEVISASDSGASYIQFTNSSTGSGTGDGTLFGIGGDEEAQIWNQENSHMIFATNNAEQVLSKHISNINKTDDIKALEKIVEDAIIVVVDDGTNPNKPPKKKEV